MIHDSYISCFSYSLIHLQVLNQKFEVAIMIGYSFLSTWLCYMISDWLNAVTCENKFATPPHQYGRL